MKLLAILILFAGVNTGWAEDDEFQGALGGMRVEQEDKISLPVEKVEEVWAFLNEKFVTTPDFLKSIDPLLSATPSEEHFADTYFDSPTFQLLGMQSGVRHRRRMNLKDADGGKELVQIKVNGISANKMERAEYKFPVKRDGLNNTPLDSHPLLGLVKPDMRNGFTERLGQLGIPAESLKPVLTVNDTRRRIYVKRAGQSFSSLSLDHVTVKRFGTSVELAEIEPELNEIGFTEADPATRKMMEAANAKIIAYLMESLPFLHQDLTPKYNKSFALIEAALPNFRKLVQEEKEYETAGSGMSPTEIAVLVSLALLVGAGIVIAKRMKRPSFPTNLENQT